MENIVQRLARREARHSVSSVSSADNSQGIELREPIVVLERTELTGEHLADSAIQLNSKTSKSDDPVENVSTEGENRLQRDRIIDGKSPPSERGHGSPRSKRPRKENGSVAVAEGVEVKEISALSSCTTSDGGQEAKNDSRTASASTTMSLGKLEWIWDGREWRSYSVEVR